MREDGRGIERSVCVNGIKRGVDCESKIHTPGDGANPRSNESGRRKRQALANGKDRKDTRVRKRCISENKDWGKALTTRFLRLSPTKQRKSRSPLGAPCENASVHEPEIRNPKALEGNSTREADARFVINTTKAEDASRVWSL